MKESVRDTYIEPVAGQMSVRVTYVEPQQSGLKQTQDQES